MKKKLISLLLLASLAFGTVFGMSSCVDEPTSSSSPSSSVDEGVLFDPVFDTDYASNVKLDMSSTDTIKKEVTVRAFIDGDTTHFNVSNMSGMHQAVLDLGYYKARYAAVNTPESTGTIEKWGKDASDFTKEKLSSATSIVIESDTNAWEPDSTGERFLTWVWYKTEGETEYRNLNIELLQYGLALPSKTDDVKYSSACRDAIAQARSMNLYLYSNKVDPDFYTGDAIPMTLKELRTNIAEYVGKRVAVEGVISAYNSNSVYVEAYDEETDCYYGISAYCGFDPVVNNAVKPGYRMRMVGVVSYWETGGTYQLNDLKYDRRDEDNPNNIKRLDEEMHEAAYTELDYTTFTSSASIEREVETEDGDIVVTREQVDYAELIMSTSVSFKNLTVVDTYTTSTGDSKGAFTLTCEDEDGNEIIIRTSVMKEEGNVIVTADRYMDKTIDVKGIVGYHASDYNDFDYQIMVFTTSSITIHE